MPIQPFVNLKEKKNTRVEWADIGLCQLKNGLNREKVSVGSQIVAHTQMGTSDGPNKPNTINL